MELQLALEELGHTVVGVAMDSGQAMALALDTTIDLALIDINLQDGPTGPAVALSLVRDRGSAAIFLTANPEQIPDGFCGALGALTKPYDAQALRRVIDFASLFVTRRVLADPPQRFRMAPWLLTPPDHLKPQ